jgi:hypothetical protein
MGDAVTEFEELALKKITKDYLIDCIFNELNVTTGRYGISNAEISKTIGWDPSGFNQKNSRNVDLRITTFIKIFVAIKQIIAAHEAEMGLEDIGSAEIHLNDLITQQELDIGALLLHISAAAEGKCEFLKGTEFVQAYLNMKPFVLVGKKNNKYSEREVDVYVKYYKIATETN